MNVGNLKSTIAAYVGRNSVADLTLNGVDTGILALNTARRKVERLHDFRYAEVDADLSIASTGTALSAATISAAAVSVKRVRGVKLPIAGSDYRPIEFLTNEEWDDRITRTAGRIAYSAAATLTTLGMDTTNPVAYQHGQTIRLMPAAAYTFPVAAKISIVRFMPDYTLDADHDFFCDFAPDYLQWAAINEINRYWRRFVPRQEGNVPEESVQGAESEALQALLAWDMSIRDGTSTPTPSETGK